MDKELEEWMKESDKIIKALDDRQNKAISSLYDYVHTQSQKVTKQFIVELLYTGAYIVETHPESVPLTDIQMIHEAELMKADPDRPVKNKKPCQDAVRFMSEALTGYCKKSEELDAVLEHCLTEYIASHPKQQYSPMLHGKGVDAMASAIGNFKLNPMSGTTTATCNGITVKVSNFNELAGVLGVSTHKLLCKGIIEFTNNNHTGYRAKVQSYKVCFSVDEYAKLCGYDIEKHPDSTGIVTSQEAKRAKTVKENFIRELWKNLDILKNTTISFRDSRNAIDTGLLGAKGIVDKGYVYMEFTQTFGDYLLSQPLTQYANVLFKISGNSPTAYTMGLQITEHYNNDNNLIRGTAQCLRVKTLLSYTSLPDLNDIKISKKSWKKAIRKPFEKALNTLVNSELLESWYYCYDQGKPLSAEELDAVDYENWVKLLIRFTLVSPVDHMARIDRKEERREACKNKKNDTAKKSK